MIGDFNCIKRAREKCGGRIVAESLANCLRDFMMNLGAIDLGFIGPSFTWSNRREGLTNIRERLDRVCVIKVGRLDSPRLGLDIFVTLIRTII